MIELTIGFEHYVCYLSNTLMPLSSLAAEPTRITIPNELPRGGREQLFPGSLFAFLPFPL